LLAEAVMGFHFALAAGNRREALTRLHRVVLQVRGVITNAGDYTTHVTAGGPDDGRWRSEIIAVGQALKVLPGESAEHWLKRARALLGANLVGTSTIGQRLRSNEKLETVLAEVSPTALPAKAIHKGSFRPVRPAARMSGFRRRPNVRFWRISDRTHRARRPRGRAPTQAPQYESGGDRFPVR
jgi:hypothetical protein